MNKLKLRVVVLGSLLATLWVVQGQEARFFRVTGPVATRITGFSADGYLTWTNELTNATFTVQVASALGDATNWVDFVQIPVTDGVHTNRLIDFNPPAGMALIPAGSFTMGDISDGSSAALPLHTNYISALYMDNTEVTKALWDGVYMWATNHGYSFDYGAAGKASTHPAHSMTWYDAAKWCNARSEKEGRVPAYYTSAGQTAVYRTGQLTVDNSWVNWSVGYRLPTEAEWEKAARGGSSGHRFPWGDTITHSQANYKSSSNDVYDISPTRGYHPLFNDGVNPYTSPAGYFAPNGYGLYDMAGNVWEWCWDWYGSYSSASQSDPRGPSSVSGRVDRGGGWYGNAIDCRSAYRVSGLPSGGGDGIGFRSVLPPGQ